MTGPSLHGIQGRFLKDGSTEYRAKGRKVTYVQSPNGNHFVAAQPGAWNWWGAGGIFTTRKAAIERIEQMLTAR